jgi:hypothetical protein
MPIAIFIVVERKGFQKNLLNQSQSAKDLSYLKPVDREMIQRMGQDVDQDGQFPKFL